MLAVTVFRKKPPSVETFRARKETRPRPQPRPASSSALRRCPCTRSHTNAVSGAASTYVWRVRTAATNRSAAATIALRLPGQRTTAKRPAHERARPRRSTRPREDQRRT
jgi:hypothetical protein